VAWLQEAENATVYVPTEEEPQELPPVSVMDRVSPVRDHVWSTVPLPLIVPIAVPSALIAQVKPTPFIVEHE